jgi:hypothetical protein
MKSSGKDGMALVFFDVGKDGMTCLSSLLAF